tara:strand:- start:561 stop:908 length:348 start_codon:yes stop_codon:yes gene_type:complete
VVFGGVAKREDDEIVTVTEEFEGWDGVGIVKVREDKNEGAFGKRRIEGEKFLAEAGGFVEIVGAKLVEPLEDGFAGEGGLDVEVPRAGSEDSDRGDSVEGGEGKTAGDLGGDLIF